MLKNEDVFNIIEKFAPIALAEEWDNVGLQIGSYNDIAQNVLLTLDVTQEVVDEAISKEIKLIISHHPLIFSGIKKINYNTAKGKIITSLIKNSITVYSAHTNIDRAKEGLSDYLGKMMNLKNRRPLILEQDVGYYKLIIYVPEKSSDKIVSKLGEMGAGAIGNYSHCTFVGKGVATFMPLINANPTIGKKDQLEYVGEAKVESIVKSQNLNEIIQAVKCIHPYEEMAYDIIPLKNDFGNSFGYGCIGDVCETLSPEKLINRISTVLDSSKMRYAGNMPQKIKKIALCTGSGGGFINIAKKQNADVYITGDIKYHEAQLAKELGLWVIDAGHYGTEKYVVKLFKEIVETSDKKNELMCHCTEFSKDYIW